MGAVAGWRGTSWLGLRATTLADLWLVLHRLLVVGLLSIAVSGLVAWGLGAVFGAAFVAGDPPGVTYTAARCADFREYAPGASSCAEAAAEHHFGEVVEYRLAAGVLGLLAAVAYVAIARRRHTAGTVSSTLPDGFEATIGAAVFGLAAGGLLVTALGQLTLGAEAGAGQYLSAGIVAAPVACAFAVSLRRALSARERAIGR